MRAAVLTLVGSLVLSAAAIPANAASTIAKPGAPMVSNIVEVSGGCGQYYYRDGYGYCQPYYSYSYGYPVEYSAPTWYPYRHWHHWQHWRHWR